METTHTDNRNIISVKVGFSNTPMVLILCYGPQETESEEVRETLYHDLKFEVIQCKKLGGSMVTAGDFNAKVSVKDEKYSADSKNGELMLSTLNDIDLSLLNYESK